MNARAFPWMLAVGVIGLAACGSADGLVSSGHTGAPSGGGATGDAGQIFFDAAINVFPTPGPLLPAADGGRGDTCLVQPVDVKGQAPDLLIVMDRSLSMAPARWTPSVQAVDQLVTQYESAIHFGLSVFPPTTIGAIDFTALGNVNAPNAGCGTAVLDVPVAPQNAQVIKTRLGSMQPGGTTPTAAALTAALGFIGPRMEAGPDSAASKPGYVLLVTDGEPNCSPTAVEDTRGAAAALLAAGIKVYVVGYNVAAAAGTMNTIAQAGGTERYYAVESPQDLDTAFRAITQDVVRCDFDLATTTNPDPKFIYITIDGREVPLDAVDGWKVDGRRITLNGASCESLKDGVIHAVSAEIRCVPLR